MMEARIVPDFITLNIAINYQCETYIMDDAFKVLAEMEAHGFVLDVITFNALMKGMYKEGIIEYVVNLYYQMVGK